MHRPLPLTLWGAKHVHAGGPLHGAWVGHEAGVGDGVIVGVGAGGVAVAVGVGSGGVAVTVGVGSGGVAVTVGVGSGGVGVGVPLGSPGVGVGVAPVISFQTARRGLIFSSAGTSVTVGSSNVGMLSPPYNIATVPAGEINITFEFCAFAEPGVQTPLQKKRSGIEAVAIDAGSQSLMNA